MEVPSTVTVIGIKIEMTYYQILGSAFPFFSPVCRGVLENEVAVECFNGGR